MFISIITNTRDGLNIGARNQALGVAEALKRTYAAAGAEVLIHEYDIRDMPRLAHVLSHNQAGRPPYIVIGVGDDGVRAFEQLPPPLCHTALLVGHEVPKGIEKVKDKISLLAIPEHVTDYVGLEGVRCIRTQGVSHAITPQKAEIAVGQWEPQYSKEKDQPVIVVMLGGTVDGKDYSPEEARKLAEYVTSKAKSMGAYILATNSPRTQPKAIEAFNEVLNKSGCGAAFFPYMKGQEESPFHALIGVAAKDPKNLVFITGDSVSMPSEAASLLQPSQLYLYPVSNLNPQNCAFIDWMHQTGRANILEYSPQKNAYNEKLLVRSAEPPLPMDAGQQIAAETGTLIAAGQQLAQQQAQTSLAMKWRKALIAQAMVASGQKIGR